MATYDSLHRQCRTLESLFDTKLTAYSRVASTISRSDSGLEASGSGARWRDMEVEIDELLEKLEETNEQLGTLANDQYSPQGPPTQSMLRAIQRHRDVWQDYARELKRTKSNVQQALDKANLLTGVRNDIDAYKSSAADSLLAERGRIDSSHRMTDDVLDQAYATRNEFRDQSASLSGINARMTGVISTMPGINQLVGMIGSKRRRDAIILGSVIGICVIIIWYAWR